MVRGMRQHRILVAGCGSIGQRHARLLAERQDVTLFLCDPVPQNLADCAAVCAPRATFTRYQDALREQVDGVFVCTPNHLHVSMSRQALAAGACVMLEKPVADSLAEAVELLEHPEANHRIAVGYVNRFDQLLQHLHGLVAAGEFGNLLHANASVYTYLTLLCAKTPFRETTDWALVFDYTHQIDLLRYLLGDVAEVAAMSAARGDLSHTARPNLVEILLRFRSGAIGSIHMDYVRHPEKTSLELVGDKNSAELFVPQGLLKVYERESGDTREIGRPYVRDDLFRAQTADFIEVLAGRKQPLVTLEDGLAALQIAEAVIESCRKQTFVQLPEM